ncbi:hypothetical protein I6N95_16995 [Vagococcus sp. BWB3-3]|uniref:DUF624 domain-containing protein n=1 Tax=Vagococcus allomyrinae TaxID=2794353 RepID=A0A940SWZ7_9ENTE|nr:hypothetical protein [Vagococcus allomyrinae]MBP1042716.1 hypothetical protein [Vagococcus allomyrinae]
MKQWFNHFLGQIMSVVILSAILIIGSLPIVTLFPTIVSLVGATYFYHLTAEWVSPLGAFRHFFKTYFLKSLACQLLWMAVMAIGGLNLSLATNLPQSMKITVSVLSVFFMGLSSVTMGNLLFSLILNPQEKIGEQLRKSLLLVMIKLPQTFLLILSVVAGGVAISLVPQGMIIVIGLVFWAYLTIEKSVWREFLVLASQNQ